MQNTEKQPFLQKHQTSLMWALVLAFFVIFPVTTHASVGKVIMAIGEVSINRGGKSIPAKKDTTVEVGDAIVTAGTSNAQVKFNDGAIIALRPNTEFKVNEYKFNGKADGTEKADVSLTKGGVRAVTGAIGRSNRDNLKVNAAVATIGIRGTGFNIVFCDASCIDKSSQSKEGLYAGVFEGKIVVANKGGASSDMGVNRFAYVANENSAPQPLIAPPNFLKDSLEAQVRVKVKDLNLNSATDSNSVDGNANAVAKAPNAKAEVTPSSETVLSANSPLLRPEIVSETPRTFFVAATGVGGPPPTASITNTLYLRAAEWNGKDLTDPAADRKLTLNATLADGFPSVDYKNLNTTSADPIYSVNSAKAYESSSDAGVIAWGRWSGGTMNIGGYGNITLTESQGWHYIVGQIPSNRENVTAGTFNLLAATKPTELRANAQDGWQVTGGSIAVTRPGPGQIIISGNAGLFLARTEGWGTFNMTWSNNVSNNATSLYNGVDNLNVIKTDGTVALCTVACGGSASTGFYGSTGSHAGTTYSFNTGGYFVNGVLIFKK